MKSLDAIKNDWEKVASGYEARNGRPLDPQIAIQALHTLAAEKTKDLISKAFSTWEVADLVELARHIEGSQPKPKLTGKVLDPHVTHSLPGTEPEDLETARRKILERDNTNTPGGGASKGVSDSVPREQPPHSKKL
jgi:hypothetical protein